MKNTRCRCGKIICQLEGNTVIIKCRHCKGYVVIDTFKLQNSSDDANLVQYKSEIAGTKEV